MHLSDSLRATLDRELPKLRSIADTEADISLRGGWTRKQELGHLLDSAANNHIRFVRAALDGNYNGPAYDQNAWVDLHGYRSHPWDKLVEFWYAYNRMLATLIGNIPDTALAAICKVGTNTPMTLRALIEDYIVHMQHHLDQIIGGDQERSQLMAQP